MPANLHDLVRTEDGYLGIVMSDTDVFLGNGIRIVLEPEEFAKLRVLPFKDHGRLARAVYGESPPANFTEIIKHG